MKRSDITELFPQATKEQIDKLMDINGTDINAAKVGIEHLQNELETARAALKDAQKAGKAAATDAEALQQATARVSALENELSSLKLANQVKELRENVAKEKGLPAALLTGDTEDACKAQADAILAFAKPSGYPALSDGGEAQHTGASKTRDQFAAWAQENL